MTMGSAVDTGLNLATVWEAIARVTPQRPALVHGSMTTSWSEFEQRSASLAALLDEHGIGSGDNVALYLYNCSEYLEATFASFKVRAATVNVNYRYLESELEYLFTDSEAKAVVFHAEFADRLESIRSRLEHARVFICVGATTSNEVPVWALDYEREIETHTPLDPIERSATDRWLLYTGGTTGSPKGVIWTHAG
ncbi:MAG: AMP-binding protein, partial [Microthrixaceae bacterium]|nr:AMP-binding protein [Microthrixaceae bacterium]